MTRVSESYRRIRNTLRFLLANLSDFNSKINMVDANDLIEIDKYALIMLKNLQTKIVDEIYPSYQFHLLVQELVGFCSESLGGFYLDILKDRLYTSKVDGFARRSAQSVLYHIANALLLMLSPILCFTADEAWECLHNNSEDSTLYHTNYIIPDVLSEDTILTKWDMVYKSRELVFKELESSRIAGVIGSSLQANLVINASNDLYQVLHSFGEDLKFVYMVSGVILHNSNTDTTKIVVTQSKAVKCERCWHYADNVGSNPEHSTICSRCVDNLFGSGECRNLA